MLKKKALRKILITTLTVVILLMVYMIPTNTSSINKLDVDKTIEYIDSEVGYAYLLNDNDLLVRTEFLMGEYTELKEKATNIINNLINSNTVPNGLKNIIPKKTKIQLLEIKEKYLTLSFSKEILEIDDKYQEKLIESISFSLFELEDIEKISILVEKENINKYFKNIPKEITREFGINKKYDIKSFKNIQKVIVYYLNEIDDKKYLVPVTSYINDSEEKIKIIIESLSSNYIYEPNLISMLDSKTELINYEIKDDIMHLNFNNSIFMTDGNILEEVVYTISNSVFDSYDVNKIVFNVENRKIEEVIK